MIPLLFIGLPAWAGVTCDTGARHRTLTDAVADDTCSAATLDSGSYFESVTIGRNFTVAGAGRDETVLFCARRPCIHATHGADVVVVAQLTVASAGTAIESSGGRLMLVDSRVAPLGLEGGDILLRDTEAQFIDVEIEVAKLPAINALANIRHSLDFDRVHFSGLGRYDTVRNAVYANSYGVTCNGCTFDTTRQFTVPKLLWDDEMTSFQPGLSRSSLYPELFCPVADADARIVCQAQCLEESVALCDMAYRLGSQTCVPEATCVPEGEVPLER